MQSIVNRNGTGKKRFPTRLAGITMSGLFTGVLLASAPAAMAAHLGDSTSDPNDARGRLDMSYVETAPIKEGRRILLKIKTREAWGCRYFGGTSTSNPDRAHGSLRWHVNANRDPYTEHTWFYGCNESSDGNQFYLSTEHHSYEARKPNGRTIVVSLPSSRGGLDKERVELTAISRSDGLFKGDALVDEEDAAATLRPYTAR